MRLAAQAKLGFYPVPPPVVAQMCRFLVAPLPGADGVVTVLDPCCGKGDALKQFGQALGAEERNLYGAELDEARGAAAKANLPAGNILAPCDIGGLQCAFSSMSLMWLNPPYDNELGGGGREEERFLRHAYAAVVRGGVLMLSLPWRVLRSAHAAHEVLMSNFENIVIVPYLTEHRKFDEVVVFGKRRKQRAEGHKLAWHREHRFFGADPSAHDAPRYVVPLVPDGGRTFKKMAYTEQELARVMAQSKLKRIFAPPAPRSQPKPGLQLSPGQRALVLAGGFLNRTLKKNGETILIKASPGKETFVRSVDEEEIFSAKTNRCEIKKTTILSERIVLRVRVLTEKGTIHEVRSEAGHETADPDTV